MRLLNYEFNNKLKKRLRDNKKAIQFLANRGLTLEDIDHFGLGLSSPYFGKKSDSEHAYALMYPLRCWDGKFYNKYGYYNIPDVTQHPQDSHSWMSGEVRTYYGGPAAGKEIVFVCQEVMELWRLWQEIKGSSLGKELLLICSTKDSIFPEEWRDPGFWAAWETIYLGHDHDEVGEQLTAKLAELIGKDVRRVRVPAGYGKTWTGFWQGGADIQEFTRLLRDAPAFSL